MSDFEQDFMAQVHGGNETPTGGANGSVGETNKEKNPIEKKWFLLGGLALVMIVALIVLNVMSGSSDTRNNNDPVANRDGVELIGAWVCDGSDVVEFRETGVFLWTRIDENGVSAKRGVFEKRNEDFARLTTEDAEKTVYDAFLKGKELQLSAEDGMRQWSCEEAEVEE